MIQMWCCSSTSSKSGKGSSCQTAVAEGTDRGKGPLSRQKEAVAQLRHNSNSSSSSGVIGVGGGRSRSRIISGSNSSSCLLVAAMAGSSGSWHPEHPYAGGTCVQARMNALIVQAAGLTIRPPHRSHGSSGPGPLRQAGSSSSSILCCHVPCTQSLNS